MNALQPSHPPNTQPPRRPRPVRRSVRPSAHKLAATEKAIKLVVNGVFMAIAAVTLARLLPHQFSQQEKLVELQAEVTETQERVARLRSDFDRHFDPNQALSVMQEQSSRIDPRQRPIVWLAPTTAQTPVESPQAEVSDLGNETEAVWNEPTGAEPIAETESQPAEFVTQDEWVNDPIADSTPDAELVAPQAIETANEQAIDPSVEAAYPVTP